MVHVAYVKILMSSLLTVKMKLICSDVPHCGKSLYFTEVYTIISLSSPTFHQVG